VIRDRNIDWARRRVFRGALDFATLVTNATGPVGSDTGAPIIAEIGTKGLGGLKASATSDVIGDYFPLPYDFDVTQPSYWRVYWTTDTTATTKTFAPALVYGQLSNNKAIAHGTSVMNTTVAADTSLGANKLHVTAWATMNADSLVGGKLTTLKITTAGSVAAVEVWVLGYELEYTPHTAGQDVGKMVREAHRRLVY